MNIVHHEWDCTVTDGRVSVFTCRKCGLVKIRNGVGEWFFTQLNRQHAACPSPYRSAAEEAQP